MNYCIYGGQYGSEGKGAVAEYFAKQVHPQRGLIAITQSSPNSGHTSSKGKLRILPTSAFYATDVILGPDSVIDLRLLEHELGIVRTQNPNLKSVLIHEHATILTNRAKDWETLSQLTSTIGSTGSGSGAARAIKRLERDPKLVASYVDHKQVLTRFGTQVVSGRDYISVIHEHCYYSDMIYECTQGNLLDVDWGHYPYVTGKNTLPSICLNQAGLANYSFTMVGVFRTYPIRVAGDSGPTGGNEITWEYLGVEPERTTVTGNIRRVFNWDQKEFEYSLELQLPDIFVFTHMDYVQERPSNWIEKRIDANNVAMRVYHSSEPGELQKYVP